MNEKKHLPGQSTEKPDHTDPESVAKIPGVSPNPPEGNSATHDPADPDDDYIKSWLRSLTILHRGHWDAARYYDKVNMGLGLATAICAAISGTTAFTQLQGQAEEGSLNVWLQVGIGIFALLAASLGAAQAFMRPSELAARHKLAGQKYGKLRREIELNFYLGLPGELDAREKLLNDFRLRWEAADEESLPVPERIYKTVEDDYKHRTPRINP